MNVFNSTFNSVSFQVTRSKELCKKNQTQIYFHIFHILSPELFDKLKLKCIHIYLFF